MNFVKNVAAGAVLGGSLLLTAGVGMANAQPAPAPDGLVNLTVGDVTILEGVSTETAATAAGAICGTAPAEVDALVSQVDGDGTQQTVCAGLPGGDLVLTQNVSSSIQQPGLTDGTDVTDGVGTAGEAEATAPVDGG
ncbi:hypothetical protein NGTWS0302_30660 [Mycolicibacterium cyprinidarum]|uniref:Secreted protein n=1 Tax=Mycolicibacterium cyprinidarum TaxID=2860311 RepID=A0ABQ4V9G1_9MYCO|nr:hypothetical protein NGTWS1702_30410 [Mycolicibacterium sp. NGTWSNA01]GJF12178.1 hypothetical protein NGTWS0302_30660 [Mycolicibacterium sp. NGTWS0302]